MSAVAIRKLGEVARHPKAREVLDRLGINHWCGAQRTLAEAVAASGARLGDMVQALEAATTLTLDVRGLEPPQPMIRVLERLDTLGADERLVVTLDRRPLILYPQLDARGFEHSTDDPETGVVRVVITRRPAA
jgi:uncharacterized protein (DUF2249 family)